MVSRVTSRLSDDWMERYGHPVLIVETFVDPQLFGARFTKPQYVTATDFRAAMDAEHARAAISRVTNANPRLPSPNPQRRSRA